MKVIISEYRYSNGDQIIVLRCSIYNTKFMTKKGINLDTDINISVQHTSHHEDIDLKIYCRCNDIGAYSLANNIIFSI